VTGNETVLGKAIATRLRIAVVLALGLGLSACATQTTNPSDGSLDPDGARRVFAAGYVHVQSKYIDPVDLRAVAIDGLKGLSSFEPTFTVVHDGHWVQVTLDRQQVLRVSEPAAEDAEAWGSLVASALVRSRNASGKLATADGEELVATVFNKGLLHLDAPSRYSTPEQAERARAARHGFGGVGVTVRAPEPDELPGIHIVEVIPETPAERARLRANDRIVRIDGEPVTGRSVEDITGRLRGLTGTVVRVSVVRDNAEPFEVSLTRAHILPPSVTYARDGSIAVVTISRFNQGTTRSFIRALRQAQREIGPGLAGFVLDLRGNPGGLLDQATAIANLFLDGGLILTTEGRSSAARQRFEAIGNDIAAGMPLAVLINGRSASAAEVLATALQDRSRAIVIGSTSYGKGSVQTVVSLPNSGELTLTWSRFYSPAGNVIDGFGIRPDICTSTGPGAQGDLEGVLRTLRADLVGLAGYRRMTPDPKDLENLRRDYRASCPPGNAEPEADITLAKRLINDRNLYARAVAEAHPGATAAFLGQRAVAGR